MDPGETRNVTLMLAYWEQLEHRHSSGNLVRHYPIPAHLPGAIIDKCVGFRNSAKYPDKNSGRFATKSTKLSIIPINY